MDEALRKHITHNLGAEYVRMAEELGFAYGVRDIPYFPNRLELYCVCCHCRGTWTKDVERQTWEQIRDTRPIEEAFFRVVHRECEIPYLPPVPFVLPSAQKS